MAIKTFLTVKEIKEMVARAPTLRDTVIIMFLADVGCRVSELVTIKVENIDMDKGLVLIPHLKVGIRKRCPKCDRTSGKKQNFCPQCGTDISKIAVEGTQERTRLVNVGEETLALIKEYLGKRQTQSDLLIPLSRQQVYFVIRDAASKAGLDGQVMLNPDTGKKHFVHPHTFRDSLAVDWLGIKPGPEGQKALQEHLGHQRFDTTARYLKLHPSQVKSVGDEVREKRFGGE